MLWLETLRSDPQALASFLEFLKTSRDAAFQHFLNAKDMNGIDRVKGRIEAMNVLEAAVTEAERTARDVADRDARRERARAGISLAR